MLGPPTPEGSSAGGSDVGRNSVPWEDGLMPFKETWGLVSLPTWEARDRLACPGIGWRTLMTQKWTSPLYPTSPAGRGTSHLAALWMFVGRVLTPGRILKVVLAWPRWALSPSRGAFNAESHWHGWIRVRPHLWPGLPIPEPVPPAGGLDVCVIVVSGSLD